MTSGTLSLSRVPFEIAASADINEFWDNCKAEIKGINDTIMLLVVVT